MNTFSYKGVSYKIDKNNILEDFNAWDENFAEGMALELGISQGLTKEHWDIIRFIRKTFEETGRVPLVYETAIFTGFNVSEGKRLFPGGYLRCACVLAGVSYKEGYMKPAYLPQAAEEININAIEKPYMVDIRGFLIDPNEWNEYFAMYRAYEGKIPGGLLTEKHWQIIYYIREYYKENTNVPSVWQTCEAIGLEIGELERLFPQGYHRGAVKLAGLRVR